MAVNTARRDPSLPPPTVLSGTPDKTTWGTATQTFASQGAFPSDKTKKDEVEISTHKLHAESRQVTATPLSALPPLYIHPRVYIIRSPLPGVAARPAAPALAASAALAPAAVAVHVLRKTKTSMHMIQENTHTEGGACGWTLQQ